MRVITGTARGRKLQTLDGNDVRPTTDMVKEAVFSVIHFRLPGAEVADIFAGCGQMGIEALSRGASKVTFVDNSRASIEVIHQNLKTTGFTKQSAVIASDAETFLAQTKGKYDIIFLDPPYNQGYGEKLLSLLARPLNENGIVLFEHGKDEPLPDRVGGLVKKKDYRYGKIFVTSYVHEEEAAGE